MQIGNVCLLPALQRAEGRPPHITKPSTPFAAKRIQESCTVEHEYNNLTGIPLYRPAKMNERPVWQDERAALLERQLEEAEGQLGPNDPAILPALNLCAEHHLLTKNYQRAEALFRRALEVTEAESPRSCERVKLATQKLAWLCLILNRTDEAEELFHRAVEAIECDKDASEESVSQAIRCRIYFYLSINELQQAEDNLLKLLNIYQRNGQQTSYQSAFCLISLAVINSVQDDGNTSKDFADRAAEIIKDKCAIGYMVDYLSLAEIINIYFGQQRLKEAHELVACTMLECEDSFWPHNPKAADTLTSLAEFMRGQKKFKQAESIYKRAIAIRELFYDKADAELARLALNLGNMYLSLRKYSDAEPLVKQAMKTRVRCHGVEHPSVAACVETYAALLRKTKRPQLANKMDIRAREIRSSCVARLHRDTQA